MVLTAEVVKRNTLEEVVEVLHLAGQVRSHRSYWETSELRIVGAHWY